MTVTDPKQTPAVMVEATDTGAGCTANRCGDQRTVQLHPHLGRRCAAHITVPPGPFRTDFAADMVTMGRPDAAFAYLGAYLAREADGRFVRACWRVRQAEVRRCWCGRPISDPDAFDCAEHDDAPGVRR